MIGSLMAEIRAGMVGRVTLPAGRFFTPTEAFYKALHGFWREGIKFIEAGCGAGDTTQEASARGFPMLGIDICERPGQHQDVLLMDAIAFPYQERLWPVICRPSHDGWVELTVDSALERGASVLYVSKPSNLDVDLSEEQQALIRQTWTNVGDDGESMWLISNTAVKRSKK